MGFSKGTFRPFSSNREKKKMVMKFATRFRERDRAKEKNGNEHRELEINRQFER